MALDGVSFETHAGTITCILGDNGAGKTTLVRILSGVHQPTSGRLFLEGKEIRFASPRQARSLGIATVHQDLGVLPLMSVWRNFVLGAEPSRGWGLWRRLDRGTACRAALEGLADMGLVVRDPEEPAGLLSGGERQGLVIARALHQGARVLILDEPTAALGVRQSRRVLEHVLSARARGVAVILVTHNPSHAMKVGDRFVVLSRGRLSAVRERGEVTEGELAALMGGGDGEV